MSDKRNDWWVYSGRDEACKTTLDEIKDVLPAWRNKTDEYKEHNAEAFVPLSDELLNAVNSAIYLRRPLLVTGEPGIGKSTLAKSIANKLNTELLYWQITSKSLLKDALYSYDALSRLHDIQMKKIYYEMKEKDEDVKAYKNISTGIENYLKLKSLGTAFRASKPVVVLIDEIDKSDIDLPNDLLHIFEEQSFEIDELKRMKFNKGDEPKIEDELGHKEKIENAKVNCKHFPIIIMTSNDEREFPPAFLRRCISIEMKLDKEKKVEQLTSIVKAHFGEEGINEDVLKIINDFASSKEKKLLSNDQLLNAIFILSKSKLSYEAFKAECEPTLLKALEE